MVNDMTCPRCESAPESLNHVFICPKNRFSGQISVIADYPWMEIVGWNLHCRHTVDDGAGVPTGVCDKDCRKLFQSHFESQNDLLSLLADAWKDRVQAVKIIARGRPVVPRVAARGGNAGARVRGGGGGRRGRAFRGLHRTGGGGSGHTHHSS